MANGHQRPRPQHGRSHGSCAIRAAAQDAIHCLDDQNHRSQLSECVRRCLRLRGVQRDLIWRPQIKAHRDDYNNHRSQCRRIVARAGWCFGDLILTADWRVIAWMRLIALILVLPRANATTDNTLTTRAPIARPLDSRPTVPIAAHRQAACEQRVAHPEPEQAEPSYQRIESAQLHPKWSLMVKYIISPPSKPTL